MADIKSPALLYTKGGLMLAVGVLSAALLVADSPSVRTVVLLAISVWGFCRAYYFAFYVIEHYVDPGFKCAGLTSFIGYVVRNRRGK